MTQRDPSQLQSREWQHMGILFVVGTGGMASRRKQQRGGKSREEEGGGSHDRRLSKALSWLLRHHIELAFKHLQVWWLPGNSMYIYDDCRWPKFLVVVSFLVWRQGWWEAVGSDYRPSWRWSCAQNREATRFHISRRQKRRRAQWQATLRSRSKALWRGMAHQSKSRSHHTGRTRSVSLRMYIWFKREATFLRALILTWHLWLRLRLTSFTERTWTSWTKSCPVEASVAWAETISTSAKGCRETLMLYPEWELTAMSSSTSTLQKPRKVGEKPIQYFSTRILKASLNRGLLKQSSHHPSIFWNSWIWILRVCQWCDTLSWRWERYITNKLLRSNRE